MTPTSALEQFIEKVALHKEGEGFPRIAGRLVGVFLLEPGPHSFGELVERLGVSRASVSTNLRLLRDRGLIERVGRPGDRQDYYQLRGDPYRNTLRQALQGIAEQTRLAVETAAVLKLSHPEMHRRLLEMAHVQRVAGHHVTRMYEELYGAME